MNDAIAAYLTGTIATGQYVGAPILPTNMQTQQTDAHPGQPTLAGIQAIVLQTKDPDIAPGTRVYVTGYIATVPKVWRQQAIGAPKLLENVNLAFAWGDLQFDNETAAVVLQAMAERITEALKVAGIAYPEDAPLPEQVRHLALEYKQAAAHLAGLREEDEQTDRPDPARPNRNAYGYVDDLPEDTKLLPEVWETLLGLDINDWDGWNDVYEPGQVARAGEGRYLGIPCTREEFERRAVTCTQNLNLAVRLSEHERKQAPPTNRSLMELCERYPVLRQYVEEIERDARLAGQKEGKAPHIAGPCGEVMPCCGYKVSPGKPSTIFWNPFSEIVQCHNCGQAYVKDIAPAPEPSVTELCAKHRNLERYILTLETEAGRRKKDAPPQGDFPSPSTPKYTARWVAEAAMNSFRGCGITHFAMTDLENWLQANHVEILQRTTTTHGPVAVAVRPVSPVLEQTRRKLPDTRPSVTHKFDIAGQKGYITLGFYDKACEQPGEVFIVVQKQGSTLQGFADAWARSVSMLLQYGVPPAAIARMFAWHKFEPRGHTTNPRIGYAHSVVDYVARWLGTLSVPGYDAGVAPTLGGESK